MWLCRSFNVCVPLLHPKSLQSTGFWRTLPWLSKQLIYMSVHNNTRHVKQQPVKGSCECYFQCFRFNQQDLTKVFRLSPFVYYRQWSTLCAVLGFKPRSSRRPTSQSTRLAARTKRCCGSSLICCWWGLSPWVWPCLRYCNPAPSISLCTNWQQSFAIGRQFWAERARVLS